MTRAVDSHLQELRDLILRMGSLAERILDKALRAFCEHAVELAREVQQDDLAIDELDLAVEAAVLRVLALQAPVADDLRQVLGSKMIATDLERVGDLSRNIAKSAIRLAQRPPVTLPPKLQKLAVDASALLADALDSFAQSDPEKARRVLAGDDAVDSGQDEVILRALEEIREHPELTSQEVDLILVAKNLERVADHATNIAEDVILILEARQVKHASKLHLPTGEDF